MVSNMIEYTVDPDGTQKWYTVDPDGTQKWY